MQKLSEQIRALPCPYKAEWETDVVWHTARESAAQLAEQWEREQRASVDQSIAILRNERMDLLERMDAQATTIERLEAALRAAILLSNGYAPTATIPVGVHLAVESAIKAAKGEA